MEIKVTHRWKKSASPRYPSSRLKYQNPEGGTQKCLPMSKGGGRESIPRQECRLRGMRILVIEDDQWNVHNQQKDSERPVGPAHICKYINTCVLLKFQNATMSIERSCPYCTLFWVRTCGSANSIRWSMVVEQEEKVDPCPIGEKRVGDTFLECVI